MDIQAQKKTLLLGAGGVLAALIFCAAFFMGNDPIALVKETPFPGDRSLTFQTLLENYKYADKGTWSVWETDRDQNIVEYRAKYDNTILFNSITKYSKEPLMLQFFNSLGENELRQDLVAQFTISKDGESFVPSYLGVEYKGKSQECNIENEYNRVMDNKPLIKSSSLAHKNDFRYAIFKYIVSREQGNINSYGTYDGEGILYQIPEGSQEYKRMYYITCDDFSYDDESVTATMTCTVYLTDLMKTEINNLDDIKDHVIYSFTTNIPCEDFINPSRSIFEDINYKFKKNCTFENPHYTVEIAYVFGYRMDYKKDRFGLANMSSIIIR